MMTLNSIKIFSMDVYMIIHSLKFTEYLRSLTFSDDSFAMSKIKVLRKFQKKLV